jgi:type I restriction enzyme, S subunit
MEVKPGYKQTEAGVIPEEWDVVPMSELVTEFHGGAPLKPSDFTATGIKVLPKGSSKE